MPRKPTKKVKKAPSKFTKLRRAEAKVQMYDETFSNIGSYLELMKYYKPKQQPAEILRTLERNKDRALKAYISQRKAMQKFSEPQENFGTYMTRQEYAIAKGAMTRGTVRHAAEVKNSISGITYTMAIVNYRVITFPDDDDTEWGYYITDHHVPGSHISVNFNHWIRDKTHCYSVDFLDLMWVISHYGFQFPAPGFDGTLYYEAELTLGTFCHINADCCGVLLVDLLLDEQQVAGAPPATWESYQTWVTQLAFTKSEFKHDFRVVTGSFPVKKDKKSILWFGLATYCSAKGGIAGTSKKGGYLNVGPPPGESQPGVKYTITSNE